MKQALCKRIVSLLPSKALKQEIENSAFVFSDIDLLSIAFQYAPDYDTRLEILKLLEASFEGELKVYTSRLIEVQRRMLASFIKHEDNEIYELHIKEKPEGYDNRYLCASYDAALKMIPLFYQEYECEEQDSAIYEITKRRVFYGGGQALFSEDELGDMFLLPGGKIESVDVWDLEHAAEGCSGKCYCCSRLCARKDVIFPDFIAHYSPVKYKTPHTAAEYGIAFNEDHSPGTDVYIVPLDCTTMRCHDYENIFNAHEHIPAPFVEPVQKGDLPADLQKIYDDFISKV